MKYIDILKHPIFILGVLIKIGLISLNQQADVYNGYIHFIDLAMQNPTNAWQNWFEVNGADSVFPYGVIMLYLFMPFFTTAKWFNFDLSLAYFATLFVFDVVLLFLLLRGFDKHQTLTLILYWLSPVILFASYFQGFNDLIPTSLMMLSFAYIKKQNFRIAGVFLAFAIATKLSITLVLPLFLLYFYSNLNLRKRGIDFVITLLPLLLILNLPMVLTPEHWQMILNNPDIPNLWGAKFTFNDAISYYFIPGFALFLLYNIWRIKKINHELLLMQSGILLLGVSLCSFAPAGWFIWSVPFFIFFQVQNKKFDLMLLWFIFNILYIFIYSPTRPDFTFVADEGFSSLVFTGFFSLGVLLLYKMWRDGILANDYFRSSAKPITIGIAGNSGVGKDLIATNLTHMFGSRSTTHISGDNYHRWDRKKSLWKAMTHLNPTTNDLTGLTADMLNLIKGRSILQKTYDHTTGLLTHARTIKANNILITSGLHILYNSTLREALDVKVYIGMSDNLRMWFKSKRDTGTRGHSLQKIRENENRRKGDYNKFIDPQKSYADVVFNITALQYKGKIPLSLKKIPKQYLDVEVSEGFDDYSLNRMLSGFCSLHLEITQNKLGEKKRIRIEGEVDGKDIQMVASKLCPRSMEFLSADACWASGTQGIMQLITLMILEDKLQQRIVDA
jgi:uridine kinase